MRLRAVPKEYEDASLALGATDIETYFKVSVPAARSGIAAAVVLGVGRAIGEAMGSYDGFWKCSKICRHCSRVFVF